MSAPGMNSLLADVYSNNNSVGHTEEDLAKQANVQFFAQLCEEKNIDVTKLAEAEVMELYKVAMELKVAEESAAEERKEEGGKKIPPPFGKHEAGESKEKEEKEEAKKKEAAARAEWAEKRAAHVKVAEADATGRIMAHALVDELRKIAAEMEQNVTPSHADQVIAAAQAKTAAAAAPVTTTSDTPNFDELAAYQAIDLLKQAGQDPNVAFSRVNAVYTLGLNESTKIASATTPEAALTVRALEFCEAAGFPVDWSKV